MGQINIGVPINNDLIQCCSCHKRYDIKGNVYEGNILICPFCGLKHQIDFKLFDKKIENLKKLNRLDLTAIDIGNTVSDRDGTAGYDYTFVALGPSNGTGEITSLELWANSNMQGVKVATFYVVSGYYLTARDSETIGDVSIGEHSVSNGNPITVSLDVVEGDYIGLHWDTGSLEDSSSGGISNLRGTGDQTSCVNTLFSLRTDREISLHGIGETIVFTYTGSGSLAFSGTATQVHSRNYLTTASGQLTYSGTATQVYSKNYLIIGSGSFAFSGTAIHAYTEDFFYTANGSFNYSGAGSYILRKFYYFSKTTPDTSYTSVSLIRIVGDKEEKLTWIYIDPTWDTWVELLAREHWCDWYFGTAYTDDYASKTLPAYTYNSKTKSNNTFSSKTTQASTYSEVIIY